MALLKFQDFRPPEIPHGQRCNFGNDTPYSTKSAVVKKKPKLNRFTFKAAACRLWARGPIFGIDLFPHFPGEIVTGPCAPSACTPVAPPPVFHISLALKSRYQLPPRRAKISLSGANKLIYYGSALKARPNPGSI